VDEGFTFERVQSPADLDAVAALEAECFTNPWSREQLGRELAQSDVARIYVARAHPGQLAAFCACWVVADELHINTMAVAEPFRRRGLGSALMRFVMADARRSGAHRATLEVRRSNEPARALYASLGFAETAVRYRYYTHPEEDAIVMWREPQRDPDVGQ
jgi:ribosomal-protein-alanine N-acetyltransferase